MTNEELINVISTTGDPDNSRIMLLWDQNSGLIHQICKKFRKHIEPEDAEQECFIAFMRAVQDYDPSAGLSFSSFLYARIQWHLIRHIETAEQSLYIPVYQRGTIRKYRKFCRQWYQANGEEPPDNVICYTFGLALDQIEQLRKDSQAASVARLDAPLASDSDEKITVIDTIPDMSVDVEGDCVRRLYDQERQRAVWATVDSMEHSKQREVIRLYYHDRLTYKQIGERIGLSTERARQTCLNGLRNLRTRKRYKVLREFVDLSPVYSRAINGTGSGAFKRTFTSATEKTAFWIMESEDRWKRQREELSQMLEDRRRDREEYKRLKAARKSGQI